MRSKAKPVLDPRRRLITTAVFASLALLVARAGDAVQPGTSASTTCDRPCLARIMDEFIAALTTASAGAVPLAGPAEIRENTVAVKLAETTWTKVKAVRSKMTFADAVTGNVVSRAGVELSDGRPAYLSTRLKVASNRRIADVEISADTSPRVVSAYVWNLDPVFTAVIPPDQRMSRIELEALARRYLHSLSSHRATADDFDPGCNRFHSGQQITNVARNSVEGGPARTCASSLEGDPPWGPATEHRVPVIDPERGVVFGLALLHYPKGPAPSQMYVSEVFKIVGGRIIRIDNIGLMMQGTTTLGFVH